MAISQGMKEIEQVLLIAGANPYIQTVSDDQVMLRSSDQLCTDEFRFLIFFRQLFYD